MPVLEVVALKRRASTLICELCLSNDPEGLASKGISSVLDFNFSTLRSFSYSIFGRKPKIGKRSTCVTFSFSVRSDNNLPSQCGAKESPLSSTLWKKEFLTEAFVVHELSILAQRTELLKIYVLPNAVSLVFEMWTTANDSKNWPNVVQQDIFPCLFLEEMLAIVSICLTPVYIMRSIILLANNYMHPACGGFKHIYLNTQVTTREW